MATRNDNRVRGKVRVFPALSSSLFQPYFLSGTTYIQIQFRVTQRRNYGNAPGKRGSDFVSSLWCSMGERNFGERDTWRLHLRNDALFNVESMRAFDVFVPTLYRRKRKSIVRVNLVRLFILQKRGCYTTVLKITWQPSYNKKR